MEPRHEPPEAQGADIVEWPYAFMELPMDEVISGEELIPYQRPLNMKAAQRIAREWDALIIDPLIVNIRADGQTYCIRGQHRRKGAQIRFGEKVRLRCRVYCDLTYEQEAMIFEREDLVHRNSRPSDRWNAQLEAREPRQLAIQRIVESAGWSVDPRVNRQLNLHAVGSLDRAYKVSPHYLTQALVAMRLGGWLKPSGPTIEGVTQFLSIYREELRPYGTGGVAGLIQRIDYAKMHNDIAAMRRVRRSQTIPDCVELALLETWNRGRRKHRLVARTDEEKKTLRAAWRATETPAGPADIASAKARAIAAARAAER